MSDVDVFCESCGARYSTAVRPEIVEALRRCGECGTAALTVGQNADRRDGDSESDPGPTFDFHANLDSRQAR